MAIQQRDFLLRIIEQLAETTAHITRLRDEGKDQEALALLEKTLTELLGPMARTVDQVDSSSAAMLLGAPNKVLAYASLVEARAKIRAAQGDRARTRMDERRALELYLLGTQGPDDMPEPVRRSVTDLAQRVDLDRLDARAKAVLASKT